MTFKNVALLTIKNRYELVTMVVKIQTLDMCSTNFDKNS